MNVALIGAHGTGKTTTLREIVRQRSWRHLTEATRYVMPVLQYENPYDFVDKYGIGFYESITISYWCVLDPNHNTIMANINEVVLLDRSPIDNIAYYYLLRTPHEYLYEDVLLKLATHHLQYIDLFILFPVGVLDLVPDIMQPKKLQEEYDTVLREIVKNFRVDVYEVESATTNERAKEIINVIEAGLGAR
jgi:predicted ATPase